MTTQAPRESALSNRYRILARSPDFRSGRSACAPDDGAAARYRRLTAFVWRPRRGGDGDPVDVLLIAPFLQAGCLPRSRLRGRDDVRLGVGEDRRPDAGEQQDEHQRAGEQHGQDDLVDELAAGHQSLTPNDLKYHSALVIQMIVSAENRSPPIVGSAHLGIRRVRTTMTFAVSAPKKKHPAIPWTRTRRPSSRWNPSAHRQW